MNFVESLNMFGVEAKEIPCIVGRGEPSPTTAGAVGMLYMNTDNGDVYKCTAVAGSKYTWEPFESGSQNPVDLTGYATEQWVGQNYQPKGEYLTEVPAGYASEQWVQQGYQPKGEYMTEVPAGYATEDFVKSKIAEAELGGEEVDLSSYALKSELPAKTSQLENDSGYLTSVPNGYATEEWVQQGYQPKGDYMGASELSSAVDTALGQAKESGEFDGDDGVSPTVDVSKTGKVTTITITDANGTKTATINDGEDGKDVEDTESKCTPQMFGAVGDGTTDDSAAFNEWFEYLADNNVFGYIPNGTYLVKSGIGYEPTAPSGKRISFVGESSDRTIIKADFADPTGKNVIAFQNCYIGEFGNLTIDNNETWANEYGITGLQLLDMQYTESAFSWIHDINIINVGRRAGLIYSSGGPGHVAIKYVNMERINAVGFTADRSLWGEHPLDGGHINPTPVGIIVVDVSHFHFVNCTSRNFHYYPLEYKNYTEYCSHENCVIENCGQGIVLGQEMPDAITIGHKYYKAVGNIVKDVPVGVAAAHLSHCTFDNNTIVAEKQGFALNSPCEYVTGAGNYCYVGMEAVQYRPNNREGAEVINHDNAIETALYNTKYSTPYYFTAGCQRCSVIVTNYQQTAKTRFVDANNNAYIPMLNTINNISDSGYELTDEDKDEITSTVLNSLPTWTGGSF